MISIIIPTYNEEKTIEKMIRQFSELRIPHEVIVSDTHSTDNTLAIAKRWADKVAILSPEKKRGVSHGRNDGAAVATGDFFVFMDCDTIINDPNAFFAKTLSYFEKDPGLVGVSVRIEVRKNDRTWDDAAVSFLMNACFAVMNNMLRMGIASGKFQMVKRDVFEKSNGFDERLSTAEDVDFFGRIAKQGRTRIIWALAVYHSGRRFHQRGAWRTLFLWMKNAFSFWLFKKPSEKWEPIR